MDDKLDHVSIGIKVLAHSLRYKLKNLYPLSNECCIYRVPEPKRCLNQSDYTPKMVSIGPLHHGSEDLLAMEVHKIRYLRYFLQRTQVSMERFIILIKDQEVNLRNCYAETISLDSDSFLRMILVDSLFLIEFLLRSISPTSLTDYDGIFGKPRLVNQMWSDLWLLENQLPLFVLNDLFNLGKTATHDNHYNELSLITITRLFLESGRVSVPIEENLLQINFSKARHFLDLLRLSILPSPSLLLDQTLSKALNIPTATELRQDGVKFKVGSSRNLLDIRFRNGILEIPLLQLNDETQRFYRNILAFENMHDDTYYFNDYVIVMHYLFNTEKEVELLIKNGILGLGFGNSDRLSTIFSNLVRDSSLTPKFLYSDVVIDLNIHCRRPWNRWKVIVRQNFAYISVFVAYLILVLTFIQTVCSIMAL